jgi:hypothetical protein
MPKPTKTLKGFKENLPTKICETCNKPYQYRKKWKLVWNEVKYCSQKCKTGKKDTPKGALELHSGEQLNQIIKLLFETYA